MLDPVQRRFLARSGGWVRTIARRSLKKAGPKPFSELTTRQRAIYSPRDEQGRFKKRNRKNLKGARRRPEQTARQGRPPLLHFKPNPLKDGATGIAFSLDTNKLSNVVGPTNFGDNAAEQIEARHPIMEPALRIAQPKLADFMR